MYLNYICICSGTFFFFFFFLLLNDVSYSSFHGVTYKYTKIILHITPLGMCHSLTIPLLMDSKVTSGFVTACECFSKQFSKCFWVCVRARMQVFLWGQIAKNRMAGLTSSTLNFFLQILLNCLPKKAVSYHCQDWKLSKRFNSLIISLITCEVKPLFIIFITCVLFLMLTAHSYVFLLGQFPRLLLLPQTGL